VEFNSAKKDSVAEPAVAHKRNEYKMAPSNLLWFLLLTAAFAAAPSSVRADDSYPLGLTLKDHVFYPSELKAPAGKDIVITLKNEDNSFEEFDSDSLHTEKIVTGNGKVTIKLKPLAAGRYPFRGENHEETAKGVLIVE
jgi:hypothetical protein